MATEALTLEAAARDDAATQRTAEYFERLRAVAAAAKAAGYVGPAVPLDPLS